MKKNKVVFAISLIPVFIVGCGFHYLIQVNDHLVLCYLYWAVVSFLAFFPFIHYNFHQ